jgi:quercetin dioxygenase-like cupin family protein
MECCLAKGELIRLDGGTGGLVLRCTGGTVWLTCGDGEDHLIHAGRSFELPAHRTAVTEALESAEFCLGEPAEAGDLLHKPVIGFAAC